MKTLTGAGETASWRDWIPVLHFHSQRNGTKRMWGGTITNPLVRNHSCWSVLPDQYLIRFFQQIAAPSQPTPAHRKTQVSLLPLVQIRAYFYSSWKSELGWIQLCHSAVVTRVTFWMCPLWTTCVDQKTERFHVAKSVYAIHLLKCIRGITVTFNLFNLLLLKRAEFCRLDISHIPG